MRKRGTKPVLGIVGGIGSGKSAVADLLAKAGGGLIVGDHLGHEALRQPDLFKRIVRRFGNGILNDSGAIDRRKLAKIVFADDRELTDLETIVFPFIERRMREEITAGQNDPAVRFLVIDAAILLETGWSRMCDKVAFVDVPRDVRLARLKQTRSWTEQELDSRESKQMPLEEKRGRADFVIDNAGSIEDLETQIGPTIEKLTGA